MPSPRSPYATTAALALLLACAAACGPPGGSADTDAGAEPAIGTPPALLDSRPLTYPLAPYVPDNHQIGVLSEAQDVLIDQCMRRYGFRYDQRRKADDTAARAGDNSRRYGIVDPAAAARTGYANPQATLAPRPPQRQGQQAPSANEKLVLNGLEVDPSLPVPASQEEAETSDVATTTVGGLKVPAGGCLRESALKLYAPTKDTVEYTVPQDYGAEAFARSRKDSRVEAAVKAWSACMAASGYPMTDPLAQPPGIDDSSVSGPRAVTMATRDVECKKQTNLVGVWYTVETAYQQRIIEKHAETLNRAKTQLADRLRLAATLLTA